MGEIAEAMVGGLLCEECGVVIDGDWPGHPRKCADCGGVQDKPERNIYQKKERRGHGKPTRKGKARTIRSR